MNETTPTEFKQEGEPAFQAENTENDNSAESSTEKETITDQSQSQEGKEDSGAKKDDSDDAGFASHPRWKEREEDWDKRFNEQEKRHVDEFDDLRKEMDVKIAARASQAEGELPAIPGWFGGTEDEWKEYRTYEDTRTKQAEERAVTRFTAKQSEEQKAIDDATKYLNDTVGEIESDKTINPKGEKVDRNKLLKFTLDNDLVDSKGHWNYKVAFKLMKTMPASTATEDKDERKKIAGATTSENRGETKQPAVTTSTDFSKPGARPW